MANAKNDNFYVVTVVRDGKRRTANMNKEEARYTVHDAVHLGYEVSCRPMVEGDPIILGVREEDARCLITELSRTGSVRRCTRDLHHNGACVFGSWTVRG